MEQIREVVLNCLNQNEDDERLIKELTHIVEQSGEKAYQIILHVLTHLDLEPEESETSWNEILLLHKELRQTLGREVSLRTAICDYFCTVHKSLRNPKVVEIHVFEKTLKNSKYDGLTNLLNRQALDEVLNNEVARANRHKSDLSLLFFDLDNFKRVNDTYGHQAGDETLRRVAGIILQEKRLEDIGARYGGEELVLVLPETKKVNAAIIGERIRSKIEAMTIAWEGQPINVTISGGMASFPDEAGDVTTLVRIADEAVQKAKDAGKNRIL